MSWNEKTVIVDEFPVYDSERRDLMGYMRDYIDYSNRERYINKRLKIEGRYDSQRYIYKGKALMNSRADWTPAQKRRIRKQGNKWRKRLLGE